ncbi:hypothetical protein FOFC_13965 [Fusarium oxysporum]|nr:hypothetical protein FOFC_13965 [Fusarium oxysporum]
MWRLLLMTCMGRSNAKSRRRSKSSTKIGLRLGRCKAAEC